MPPYLPLEIMPFAFLLLELFLDGFLLFFHPLVPINQAIYLCFQLFNIVETHREVHHKTSCWSLVLTQSLVKLRCQYGRPECESEMRSPSLDRSSTALVLRWFVVTKHRIPRHVTMSDHQGVIFFPPTDVAPFPAKKSNHIHHIRNFLLV